MKKTLILGNGFIASHLPYEKLTDRIFADDFHINALLNRHKPDVIINTIGRCGNPNIDQCEQIKTETYLTNTIIPAIIASECEKLGIYFLQMGSGCIFSGVSPSGIYWKETDYANPVSYYSRTKYACDLILGELSNTCIMRIRMPVSSKDHPRNLINKLKKYKQVIDIPNSITILDDLVSTIDWAIKENKIGIYNVVNPQPTTAAKIMREYQKYHPEHQFEIITEKQLDEITAAKRSNCILDTDKLYQEGRHLEPTEQALTRIMEEYCKGENNGK